MTLFLKWLSNALEDYLKSFVSTTLTLTGVLFTALRHLLSRACCLLHYDTYSHGRANTYCTPNITKPHSVTMLQSRKLCDTVIGPHSGTLTQHQSVTVLQPPHIVLQLPSHSVKLSQPPPHTLIQCYNPPHSVTLLQPFPLSVTLSQPHPTTHTHKVIHCHNSHTQC